MGCLHTELQGDFVIGSDLLSNPCAMSLQLKPWFKSSNILKVFNFREPYGKAEEANAEMRFEHKGRRPNGRLPFNLELCGGTRPANWPQEGAPSARLLRPSPSIGKG